MLVLMLGTFRVNSKSVILIQFCIYMLRLLGIWFQANASLRIICKMVLEVVHQLQVDPGVTQKTFTEFFKKHILIQHEILFQNVIIPLKKCQSPKILGSLKIMFRFILESVMFILLVIIYLLDKSTIFFWRYLRYIETNLDGKICDFIPVPLLKGSRGP